MMPKPWKWDELTEESKYALWSDYVDTAQGPVLDYSTYSDLMEVMFNVIDN